MTEEYMDTQNTYKTFDDLTFEHRDWDDAQVGRLDLGNDIQISVVGGGDNGLYGDGENNWEIAFFHDGDFVPLSPFDDVLGWQTQSDITLHMIEAQKKGVDWVNSLKVKREESRKELDISSK